MKRLLSSESFLRLFWLLVGVAIVGESFRLRVGTLQTPGSGFFPFLIGSLIAILSIVLAVEKSQRPSGSMEPNEKPAYKNVILCVSGLYAFSIVFEWLGFIVTVCLLMLYLLRVIGQKSWMVSALTAILSAMSSYVFFRIVLGASFPKGILGI